MRITTPLITTTLLGLSLLGPTALPAQAVGETCRGEAATIVGTGPSVTGTAGRDVIVTGPAGVVDALGGDDLVCVTAGPTSSDFLTIDAGSGADLVDTTALPPGYYVSVVLGSGADTFAGGRSDENVYAGERTQLPNGTSVPGADTEKDTIDTGEAGDSVSTGSVGAVNHDVVSLGLGNDSVSVGSLQVGADASLDGGEGTDRLRLATGATDITLDMAAGTFTTSFGTGRATAFEGVNLSAGTSRVTYRGTPGNDVVDISPTGGMPKLDIATAGGQDEIVLEPATIAPGSRIDGGDGRNGLVAANASGTMSLDLPRQELVIDGQPTAVTGLQDAFLISSDVSMVGDDRANILSFAGCEGDLTGGDGRDRLLNVFDSYFEAYTFDCRTETRISGDGGADELQGGQGGDTLSGGGGNDTIDARGGKDRIRGGSGRDTIDGGEGREDVRGGGGRDRLDGKAAADTLIGGPGRDVADGSGGRDRCVAERERRCER
jgi:Ca2+-binding RTX toxin-like protein